MVERWRAVFSELPDPRTGENRVYTMADIALSAFAVFFTQCPSFLSFQQNMEKAHGRNNARSLFSVERIPCDNHIRQTLDPVAASEIFVLFDELHTAFEQTGLLQNMRAVKNTRLIALDATWYFSSQSKNIHCQNCSCICHSEGQTTHYHSAITPLIVSPGHAEVVPLRPEFIGPQDGQLKQDCEPNAGWRPTPSAMPPATILSWATIFTPINLSAVKCCCIIFTFCSPASPRPIRTSTNGWKPWNRAAVCIL